VAHRGWTTALAVFLVGCGGADVLPPFHGFDASAPGADAFTAPDAYDDPPQCTSALTWDEGLAPAPEMHPGRTCVRCHADENSATGEGDAPIFGIAGTIFPTHHEPDDCLATSAMGATITIVDSTGARFDLTANASGNFYLDEPTFVPPYRVRVDFDGRFAIMRGAQSDPDCNSCHTQDGAHAAPGRIVLP
jgi:cytochrome c553